MNLTKITQLSKELGISSRSLRYYEQVGLINSARKDGEKYRYFSNKTIDRLKQIIVLRKMQIPIKDIIRIYDSQDMSTVVSTFVDKIKEIDDDVDALYELRSIVNEFLQTMLNNGIKKISALPLIYEEMEKQMAKANDHEPISINKLDDVSKKVSKPIDIRVIELTPMRVLSSYKKNNRDESDVDGFWQWINERGLSLGSHGDHSMFDFQESSEAHNFQSVMMIRIPEDFHNDSPYVDSHFDGGLFAVASTFVYDGIGECHDAIIKSFDDNKFYEVDYRHDGSLRHESLVETVISPDERNDKVDVFVAIKKRVAEAKYFDKMRQVAHISIGDIECANPILQSIDIDFAEITPILNPHYEINQKGEAEYIAWVDKRVLSTNVELKMPFRVDITFRANQASLRLYHGKAAIMVNSGEAFDLGGHKSELHVFEPVFGTLSKYKGKGIINVDGDNHLTWIVGEKYFAVILNGEVRHCGTDYPYMQMDINRQGTYPVMVGSNSSNKVVIKSISVSKIRKNRKTNIKDGELAMIRRQSNNILPNIHNLVTYHHGMNYMFNGCMQYLMECLDEKFFDYWFFAGLTGDSLAQLYTFDYGKIYECVSKALFGKEYVKKIFDTCGYSHTYVTAEDINSNKEMYLNTVIAYIDKGIPIVARGIVNDFEDLRVICGYEEYGKTLLCLHGDAKEPARIDTSGEIREDWIFAGAKKEEVDIRDVYRNAILDMHRLITMPKSNNCTFGAQAFLDWADDIERGRFCDMSQDDFDQWRDHTVFVCILATNIYCREFLKRAQKACPEIKYISKITDLFGKQEKDYKELEEVNGGFNVTLDVLQDEDKRKKIAEIIRRFAVNYREMEKVLNENI